jgi:hypothetical protein
MNRRSAPVLATTVLALVALITLGGCGSSSS